MTLPCQLVIVTLTKVVAATSFRDGRNRNYIYHDNVHDNNPILTTVL